MRQLYITRGIPGSGKSTFIKENGLEAYTISPDTIRSVMGSPVLNTEGRFVMPVKDDAKVWQLLYELLASRMARGELIVVDATHTLPRYFNDYAKLAWTYRYKTYVIDFADVSLEVCKQRNSMRDAYKIVNEKALETMYARLRKLKIPKYFTILKPDEVSATLQTQIIDLGRYKRIHHIGDIQGCCTPLRQYFEQYLFSEDEYYIFIGDLLDRGTENAEVLQYLCEQFVDRPNVTFIEGNHDLYLWQWLTRQPVTAREFNGRTRSQLEAADEAADIDKAAVGRMLRSMRECLLYAYHDKQVLVSHGGISTVPERLQLVSSEQYIRGAGAYSEVGEADDAFVATTPANTYQIHGHRNQQDYPTRYNERCFNLEGKVEFGGNLRVVQLTARPELTSPSNPPLSETGSYFGMDGLYGRTGADGFHCVEIPNQSSGAKLHPENAALVHRLRTNRHISEKMLPGNISSFHFKSEVVFNNKWSKQTLSVRGLFINTLTNEIVIRAYDKFFNVNERRDTELPALKQTLAFPVKAWVKENGYLGLVGYDDAYGDLVFASKTTTEGDYATWFKQLFMRTFGNGALDHGSAHKTAHGTAHGTVHEDIHKGVHGTDRGSALATIRDYLRDRNVCLAFEVVLPKLDPHIIEYDEDHLVLLDIIKRQEAFEALASEAREEFAASIGARTKRLATEFADWEEFEAWYGGLQLKPGDVGPGDGIEHRVGRVLEAGGSQAPQHATEGFVLEDARHFQVKIKLDFYTFWKQLRGALDNLKAGKQPKVGPECVDPEYAAEVIAFMQTLSADEIANSDIIDIRRKFLGLSHSLFCR